MIKLSELIELWKKDCQIDNDKLDYEAARIPTLHGKYWEFLLESKRAKGKLKHELNNLTRLKTQYYLGQLSQDELEAADLEPFQLKLMKNELPMYLSSDKDISSLKTRIENLDIRIEFLEDIVKSLHNRGFQLKTSMDFIKFMAGLS